MPTSLLGIEIILIILMNKTIKINMVVIIIVVFMMVEGWRIVLRGGRYIGNDGVDMKIAKYKQQLN